MPFESTSGIFDIKFSVIFLFLSLTKIISFIYSSLKRQRGDKNTVFVADESPSILYSSKIVYLQVDWFTGYDRIMIEH